MSNLNEVLNGVNSKLKKPSEDNYVSAKILRTPLGEMLACCTDSGISMLEFADKTSLPQELEEVSRFHNASIRLADHPFFEILESELNEYFLGERKDFTVKIDPVGTEFQKKIWNLLRTIPHGTTQSYAAQAKNLGNPKAVRAVANANRLNKISIVIPCHRVIGSNGKLTGYGGGLERKQQLLEIEKAPKLGNR